MARSSLSVFRSIGSTFGAMPAMVLASMCYVKLADGSSRMDFRRVFVGVCIIAALSVLAYLLCYAWNKERVESRPAPRQKGETMKVIRILLKSRPFMAVSLASMLFLAAQMFGQGYNSYLFHHYFKQPGLTMLPTVFQYLPVAVVMFFATRLGNRLGRREVCSYGVLLAAVFYLALFVLALFGVTNVWLYLAACLASGVGTAFIFLLIWVMATDAIDYNKVAYGLNDEATSYAFYAPVSAGGRGGGQLPPDPAGGGAAGGLGRHRGAQKARREGQRRQGQLLQDRRGRAVRAALGRDGRRGRGGQGQRPCDRDFGEIPAFRRRPGGGNEAPQFRHAAAEP